MADPAMDVGHGPLKRTGAVFLSHLLAQAAGQSGGDDDRKSSPDVMSITLFTALISLCIILGHLLEESRWLSESFTAITIGLLSGGCVLIFSGGASSHVLRFNEELFFIYLLPPIIFNAGFQVKKKQFFRNFMTIIMYGVVGTFISFIVIAFGAYYICPRLGFKDLTIKDYLALGSIFSATDSVCTLQILDQNETPFLYALVFGEGVVNDAASVVLFRAIQSYDFNTFGVVKFLSIVASFSYLFLTSTALGIVTGLLTAYVIKRLYIGRHSTDREIALMTLMAYLSYVFAELLELSGILTVFFCGIVMSHYAWHNVTEASRVTSKHAFATMSYIAETFIFLYVGLDALDPEKWGAIDYQLAIKLAVSLLLLLVLGRAAFVFPLSYLSNFVHNHSAKLHWKQMVVIWWAGMIRGAVTIALAFNQFTQQGDIVNYEQATIICTTILVVLFTTIVFGLLTRPIIKTLQPHKHYVPISDSEGHSVERGSTPDQNGSHSPLLGSAQRHESNESSSLSLRDPDEPPQRLSSLAALLMLPAPDVHSVWRRFDDSYMRPMFGGRGFVQLLPEDGSTHHGLINERLLRQPEFG
eukprot:SM000068S20564  [mRNA]  locus=s68:119990:125089:- [translate_table: standard]